MAHLLTRRVLLKICEKRFIHTCNSRLITDSKTIATQSLPEVDVEKLSVNSGPSAWKLCAAVCLVRLPILEAELSDFEKRYAALKEELEHEQSILSPWEIEKIRQGEIIKSVETGKANPEDIDFKITNQDIEDGYETALNQFKESSEELSPDDADMTNMNRRPHESLVLITKQKLGNDIVWMLPMLNWQEDENLRESAERTLESHCGPDTGATFISNGPSGFYKYKYPKEARSGDAHVGAKLFIYNAFLPRISETAATHSFKMADNDAVLAHAWVAKDEMRSHMKPKYCNAIDKIML